VVESRFSAETGRNVDCVGVVALDHETVLVDKRCHGMA
jgi:hypothetical protein